MRVLIDRLLYLSRKSWLNFLSIPAYILVTNSACLTKGVQSIEKARQKCATRDKVDELNESLIELNFPRAR